MHHVNVTNFKLLLLIVKFSRMKWFMITTSVTKMFLPMWRVPIGTHI